MRARLRLQSKTTQIDEHFHIHRIGFALTTLHVKVYSPYKSYGNKRQLTASLLRFSFLQY